jgi:FlaA1/EpsC-like NDP-sugar epimerase
LIRRHGVSKLLLAMPFVPQSRQSAIITDFSKAGIEVQVLPSYIELMSGKGLEATLRPVSPDQLLGRNNVAVNTPEITNTYSGSVVMITGAGGSIGSELCRQLINCKPSVIVLFEQGEFALYSIDHELRVMAADKDIKMVSRLGSVIDRDRVTRVVAEENIEIILHAAAYKHVPVEDNELKGARNNVLGTQIVADVAAAKINRFILVSPDKYHGRRKAYGRNGGAEP